MSPLWPPLPLAEWRNTCETLHRYAQIVGKIQLALTPLVNHWWNVPFELTARGLATSAMPYAGQRLQIEFDLVDHALVASTSDGQRRVLPLRPRAVADFYADVMALLGSLGVQVAIWEQPVEISEEVIPFSRDRVHASYDAEAVERFLRVISQAASVMEEFRARFIGKGSPVGFYWGTFDLAVARYSGRRAPGPLPESRIEREAFSHEVSECGFWPGDARFPEPAFYAMHAPAPDGYRRARVRPDAARYDESLRCFVLPYEAVRAVPSPHQAVLDFFQSTYEAGAELGGWNREELERGLPAHAQPGPPAPEAHPTDRLI
jgi:hypothetical protein